jgi:hydrogenase/urease accessory protein HupE
MIRALVVAMLALLAAAPAAADTLRPGYLELTQTGAERWQLVWKLPVQADLTPDLDPILPSGCMLAAPPSRSPTATALVSRAAVRCAQPVAGARIGMAGLGEAQTDIIVRVAPLDRPVQTLRLTPAQPTATIAAQPGRWDVAGSYFIIGVEHIIFGYDHLLFVLAFVLLLDGVGRIAAAVTAFTVAHSVTLVGTTLGYVGLPAAPVESVIALSIMFLAVEILKKEPGRPRLSERAPWIVAFGFGLLHGFGFAGALAEIGLPEGEVPMALLAFNLGVEAGQIAIVLTGAAALALVRRIAARLEPAMVRAAAYAIGIVAGVWFVERTLG